MYVVADENMPALEALLGPEAVVQRVPGRDIRRHHLEAADALLVRSVTRVDAELLQGTPVTFVGSATAGTDHIDVPWLQGMGIGFANAPGANANSVVEYVLAAIAAVDDYLERCLDGASVGIVGCGHVGRALADRMGSLGISRRVFDPWLDAAEVPDAAALEDVLACDVVCLHPELTRKQPWPSYRMLQADQLATIGASQLLINASRGAVIDQRALLQRLRSPGAPAVVLDVWENEPAIDADLLATVRLGTAHIAGYSLDGKILASRMLCAALGGSQLQSAPGSAAPVVALDKVDSTADALRRLLHTSYDIAADDRLLRDATIGWEPAQAARNFDGLRKDYAERRELAGRRVTLTAGAHGYRSLVSALGCIPELAED